MVFLVVSISEIFYLLILVATSLLSFIIIPYAVTVELRKRQQSLSSILEIENDVEFVDMVQSQVIFFPGNRKNEESNNKIAEGRDLEKLIEEKKKSYSINIICLYSLIVAFTIITFGFLFYVIMANSFSNRIIGIWMLVQVGFLTCYFLYALIKYMKPERDIFDEIYDRFFSIHQ